MLHKIFLVPHRESLVNLEAKMSVVISNVAMEEFISWFEFQLAKCLSIELRQLNDSLSFMFGLLNFLKVNGSKLRYNHVTVV